MTDADYDPMNDNTNVSIKYKDIIITIETPFSDFHINCTSSGGAFDEFVSKLSCYTVKWWDRFI